ncbi:MAG: squalene synthase HpnC [Chloroflexi bacterium]|nr:squalene synthase HpnC [Chloroflexota bacterium]
MPSQFTASTSAWTREAASRYCARLARSHYENFTVGSWLVPRDKLRHIYAVYAYCRTVDDLGDEALPEEADAGGQGIDTTSLLKDSLAQRRPDVAGDVREFRLALLDLWQRELEACYSGLPTHPVMVALQETIETFDIPREPFLKLIEANRMEQRASRYATYGGLLDYCQHSANPVGHLFLYLFGYRDEERQRLSDSTCTALQLANFWQDVARDYQKGRIYLPQEDMEQFGYSEAELSQGVFNPNFQRLMAFEVERAMDLFRVGADLVPRLSGVARLDVSLFTRGGVSVLEAIRRRQYDVLSGRPSLSRARKARLFLSSWLGWKLGLRFRVPG